METLTKEKNELLLLDLDMEIWRGHVLKVFDCHKCLVVKYKGRINYPFNEHKFRRNITKPTLKKAKALRSVKERNDDSTVTIVVVVILVVVVVCASVAGYVIIRKRHSVGKVTVNDQSNPEGTVRAQSHQHAYDNEIFEKYKE